MSCIGAGLPELRAALGFACVANNAGTPSPSPPEGMSLRRRVIAGRGEVHSQYAAKISRINVWPKNTAKNFPDFYNREHKTN